MAKGKRKKRKPGAGYTAPAVDTNAILAEVEALLPTLEQSDAGSQWGDVQRLLVKAKADPSMVARAVVGRDPSAVQHIINVLKGLEVDEPEEEATLPDIPGETLREAMKAFRKRMKLIRLDHESKLGRSPLTGGKDAGFDSILPPEKFPAEVWKVLVARGELESTGRGFYKIPEQRQTF
ncbi:MAG: hypothetical protein VX527_09765 [Planctomycetota bacterium]|nr:hypothetical protein [Planctomycetota bacterium]